MARFYDNNRCEVVDGRDFIWGCYEGFTQLTIEDLFREQGRYLHLSLCKPCADHVGEAFEELAVGSDRARDKIVRTLSLFDDSDSFDRAGDYQI